MTTKRSEWMRGLLCGEEFIKHSGWDCAMFYAVTELWQDSNEYQTGWMDALKHYKNLAVS